MTTSLFLIALPFAVVGAIMAYLIGYNEMRHHFPASPRAFLEAAKLSGAALVFLLLLSWGLAGILPALVR